METPIWQKPFSCFFEKHAADPFKHSTKEFKHSVEICKKSKKTKSLAWNGVCVCYNWKSSFLPRFIFNLLCKPLDWLLYDNGIRHERDNWHTFLRRVTAIKKYVNKKFGCQHDRWSDSIFRTFLSTVSISKFFFKMTACQEFFWMIYGLF